MNDYICLHAHSAEGSIRDSILRIDQYVSKCKEFGMDAVGLSDHGSLGAIYKFYKECKKQSVKPILSMESYYVPNEDYKDKSFHLGIIAKNNVGLSNLYKIGSLAYTNFFYRKPRVTKELLFNNSEGLIITAGCMAGPFQQLFLNDKKDEAIVEIKSFMKHFKEDFYLEVHKHGIPEEDLVRDFFREVSYDLKCGIVGGTDCHFLLESDKVTHNSFKGLSYGTLGKQGDDGFDGTGYHVLSKEEFSNLFSKEECDFTLEIADKCNVSIKHNEYHLPRFDTKGINKFEYIRNAAFDGLVRIGKDTDPIYIERLNSELEVIHTGRLEDYFLIVADNIKWCEENSIPVGCGRGSSAGSMLAYCLGITKIDPIPYKLMFSRMLNKGRLMRYKFID